MFYDGDAAGDARFGFTASTGSTLDWGGTLPTTGAAANTASIVIDAADLATSLTAGTTGASTRKHAQLLGLLVVGGTAGDVTLQFAQATSSATATRLRAGSWLRLVPVT